MHPSQKARLLLLSVFLHKNLLHIRTVIDCVLEATRTPNTMKPAFASPEAYYIIFKHLKKIELVFITMQASVAYYQEMLLAFLWLWFVLKSSITKVLGVNKILFPLRSRVFQILEERFQVGSSETYMSVRFRFKMTHFQLATYCILFKRSKLINYMFSRITLGSSNICEFGIS